MEPIATDRGEPEAVCVAATEVLGQVRDMAMFLVDRRGRAASWNRGVGEILGWDEADWLGQPVQCPECKSSFKAPVRDGDRLVNIGKAYSGLTDEEIRRMGTRFRAITTGRYGPVRAVSPEVVIEVAFDAIQKSTRHKSGYALRFPRIVRLRPDKTPAQANTLEDVRQILASR